MNPTTIKKRKDYLDYLKALSTILIVAHHVITYTDMLSLHPFVLTFIDVNNCLHLPLFFCIAGYLCRKKNLKIYFKQKVERIIFPFITFSSLKIFYNQFISDAYAHADTLGGQLFDAFIFGTLYWFIYAIFLMFTIAPLLWKSRRTNIFIFIFLIIANLYLGDPTFHYFQMGAAFFNGCFFVVGILIQQYEEELAIFVKKYNSIILTICSIIVSIATYLLYIRQIYFCFPVRIVLGFPLMYVVFTLSKKLPENIQFLKTMGKYSLQIMFFDSFFKVLLFGILTKLNLVTTVTSILTIPVNIFLSCISCMIIKKIPLIRKFFGL